ncbi:probable jasmonic acid carboxyl methyltransferase 2 [Macadamia integrifolia]|uniref:probable jasmonic acid carboxyl methyltransferase 2 n=1 Tax=Macadamia integrifolia TaxID=60698 RepID=UPI001C4F92A0|nr:probable jasmonic acid carboxyl methyltransferase 2 [Macadamia integrifolia]
MTKKTAITKAKEVVASSIVDLYSRTLPKCLCIADLGCGSGPNTLLVITEIIDAIELERNGMGHPPLEYQVVLNDLPGNDFNSIFKSLPIFYEKTKKEKEHQMGPCFISGVPGSFLGRLFPSKSLHFVHSSYGVHWLSQAYLKQFQKDFSVFLRSRYEEIVPGGHMVITLLGRTSEDDFSTDFSCLKELLAKSLNDLVSQGLIEEAKADSFNLPLYAPCVEEVRAILQTEGSFDLEKLEMFETNWDLSLDNYNEEFVFDKYTSAQNITRHLRAITESLLVQHLGDAIINNIFQRFTENIEKHLSEEKSREKSRNVNLVISLRSKN